MLNPVGSDGAEGGSVRLGTMLPEFKPGFHTDGVTLDKLSGLFPHLHSGDNNRIHHPELFNMGGARRSVPGI